MNPRRPPFWSKSMLRQIGEAGGSPEGEPPAEPAQNDPPSTSLFTPAVLGELGLAHLAKCSKDPAQFALQLAADDAKDGKLYVDEFARGIRRAVRLQLALGAQLHRRENRTWKEWVATQFEAGYECYQRYRLAAEIQAGLISRGLPKLQSEAQARALVPFRKQAKFWNVLAEEKFNAGFPAGADLRKAVQAALTTKPAVAMTPRLVLHRSLDRLVKGLLANDDPAVTEALALLRRALHVLEKGST